MKERLAALVALVFAFGAQPAPAQDSAATVARIGEARAVAGLQSASGVGAQLRWAELPGGGQVAALRITSSGAAALRAGLRVGELPASAVLRFSSPGDARVQEVAAAKVLEALARNRDAGESGPDARTYWSPLVAGDTLVVEIELAAGTPPAQLRFAVPMVSHLREWTGAPASGDESDASAVVTVGGSSFACPGMLVASRDGGSPEPYFLTHGRCVASQAAASSLQVFWRRASSGVGARLLYASGETDAAFVVLDAPPASAASLTRRVAAGFDPALEQWLGDGAASSAPGELRTFSSP